VGFSFFRVSSLAYPNLLGKKGYVVVVVVVVVVIIILLSPVIQSVHGFIKCLMF